MLKLESYITLDLEAIQSPNLCDRFSEEDLKAIGAWVYAGYDIDKQSRLKWEQRTAAAMDLAMQIQKAKTFPWPNCSNVAFPLVTIGVMQFHARAYSAIVDGQNVVRYRVFGDDPTGTKTRTADRVGSHMSWQLLEQDEDWEPQHDRLLINLATVGCAFKKSYYNGRLGQNDSDLVMARDLVLNYWSSSVAAAPRKTHVLYMSRNDIYERVQRKTFCDVLEEAWYSQPSSVPMQTTQMTQSNNRSGVNPPERVDETTPFTMLEQHCLADLDGDGYEEPYIITIEERSKTVLRIVTRFDREEDIERAEDGKIISIRATEFFTKYTFLPSPDGGIYDIGFGVLLGPLNESVNSLMNQLIDAGTMSVTAGGFLGRGAKIRGGVYTFAPLEWKRVDSTGEDLSKSIYPLPVREPSAVLFNLLSLLVNYTQRISGSTDMMVGENPGQNTPAETSRLMVEQGTKIYNSIFKRVWRSMKDEFRKLYVLNAKYLPNEFTFGEGNEVISQQDYRGNPDLIAPVADPNITSENARIQQAMALKQSAMSTPGYNIEEVERRWLRAIRIEGVDIIYPGPKAMPPPESEKIQIEKLRAQQNGMKLQFERQKFAAELMEEQRMNNAEILKIQAEIIELQEANEGDKLDRQINAMNTMLAMLKQKDEKLESRISMLLDAIRVDNEKREIDMMEVANVSDGGAMEGMAAESSDPSASQMGMEQAGVSEGEMGGGAVQ